MTIKTWLYSSTSEASLVKSEEEGLDLAKRFPNSTEAERRRFLNARDNDHDAASKMMSDYFDWRDKHGLESNLDQCASDIELTEESQWQSAVSAAAALCGDDPETVDLPRLARFNCHDDAKKEMRDTEGRRVLQFFPGLCDFTKASEATHVLAIAFFLDKLLDRSEMEKITLIIDVRAGKGWANLSPSYLVPFIRKVSRTLQDNFPERLAYCLVFPVPYAATVFWSIVKVRTNLFFVNITIMYNISCNQMTQIINAFKSRIDELIYTVSFITNQFQQFLDPDTAQKIQLLSGSAGINSPPPTGIDKFFDDNEVK